MPWRIVRVVRQVVLATPSLALVVALVTWPVLSLTPGVGLDPSWEVALQMATQRGFDWGTQVIFSYGPLGFLSVPLTMCAELTTYSPGTDVTIGGSRSE